MNALIIVMYVVLLANTFAGIALLFYGVKMYATGLTALYCLPLIGLMLVFYPIIPSNWIVPLWIAIGVTTLLVFALSKPVTYFVMPLLLVSIVLALFALALKIENYDTLGIIGAVVVIAIWVIMFIKKDLREYMKAIVMGSLSASILVVSILVLMWKIFQLNIPIIAYAIAVPVCFIGGVLMQFLYVLPRNKTSAEGTTMAAN